MTRGTGVEIGPTGTGQSDGGDAGGWAEIKPDDPEYPTPEQLGALKGFAAGEIHELTDEEVDRLLSVGAILLEGAPPLGTPKKKITFS